MFQVSAQPRLFDLRDENRPRLFDAFVHLYYRTFTEPSEREDPAEWPERLWGKTQTNASVTHLLVAAPDPVGSELAGGLLFESFCGCSCGLLGYLAVNPNWRRKGVARLLVETSRGILREDARRDGERLQAVFAEVEDPDFRAQSESIPPFERWLTFRKLGAKWIDIPYVQPALKADADRAYHLRLLAFTEGGATSLEGETIRSFLSEYYRSCGIEHPEKDPDIMRMLLGMGQLVSLRDLGDKTGDV